MERAPPVVESQAAYQRVTADQEVPNSRPEQVGHAVKTAVFARVLQSNRLWFDSNACSVMQPIGRGDHLMTVAE